MVRQIQRQVVVVVRKVHCHLDKVVEEHSHYPLVEVEGHNHRPLVGVEEHNHRPSVGVEEHKDYDVDYSSC